MKIPNKKVRKNWPKPMIFHNFWTKIDSFHCEWQDLAQNFDILRNFKAKKVNKLKKLHLKFERSQTCHWEKIKYGVLSYRVKYGQNTEQVCTRNTGKSCKICFKYGGEAESYLSLGLNEMLKYKMFSKVN